MANESWTKIDKESASNRAKFPRMSDFFEVYDKQNYIKTAQAIRLLGPVISNAMHAVKVKRRTPIEGKPSEYTFMVPCASYDPIEGKHKEGVECPYCKAGVRLSYKFYQNAIIRELEENPPMDRGVRSESEKTPRKFGTHSFYMKDRDSKAWTPVRVIEIPKALTTKLGNIEAVNYYKDAEGKRLVAFLNDIKNGIDLFIKYNKDSKDVANMYDVQPDIGSGKTPITKEIRDNIMLWDLFAVQPVDPKEVEASFKQNCDIIIGENIDWDFINNYIKEKAPEKLKKTSSANKPAAAPIKSVSLDEDEDFSIDEKTPAQTVAASDLGGTSGDGADDFEVLDIDDELPF